MEAITGGATRLRRRAAAGILAAALATAAVSIPAANSSATVPVPSGDEGALATKSGTVTLITGDRVTLHGAGRATVKPAKGRERVKFAQRIDVDGDVHVTPVGNTVEQTIIDAYLVK